MSIKFIPERLKDEAEELFTFFEEYGITANDEIDLESYFYTGEDTDQDIFVDRKIQFDFYFDSGNNEYENHNISLDRLLDVVSEAKKRKTIDGYKFIGDKVALIPIDSHDDSILKARYQAPDIVTQYIKNKKYTIEIVEDITSYGMSLIIEDLYTEYIPAFNYEDIFIEIRCDDRIDETVIDDLVQAYLFELKSSFKLNIHTSQRVIPELTDTYDEDDDDIPSRARPLLEGKGIRELLQIYNSTLSTADAEILMLNYTKVIEYVSQTVIQQELIEEALKKLASPKVLKPIEVSLSSNDKLVDIVSKLKNIKGTYDTKLPVKIILGLLWEKFMINEENVLRIKPFISNLLQYNCCEGFNNLDKQLYNFNGEINLAADNIYGNLEDISQEIKGFLSIYKDFSM